jgi:hypothetical protein
MSARTKVIVVIAIGAAIAGLGLTLTQLHHGLPFMASAVWGS